MYNNDAASEGLCTGDAGLQQNGAWNTWRRNLDVCAVESSHSCDYIGDAEDTDWVLSHPPHLTLFFGVAKICTEPITLVLLSQCVLLARSATFPQCCSHGSI